MSIMPRLLLSILLIGAATFACQPPPSAFQHSSDPVSIASGQTTSARSGVAAGPTRAQASSFKSASLENGLPSESDYDTNEIEAFNQGEKTAFTPYPGYIPPPPPAASAQGVALQPAARTFKSSPGFSGASPSFHPGGDGEGNGIVPLTACRSEIKSLREFGDCVDSIAYPQPERAGETNKTVCSFEEGTECRFRPAPVASFQSGRFASTAVYDSLADFARKDAGPSGGFAYASLPTGLPQGAEVALVTAVGCMRGSAVLTFDYWLLGSQTPEVKVCTSDHRMRSCTQAIAYTDSPSVRVDVVHPTDADAFSIEIVFSSLTSPTVIAVDNLVMEANLCESASASPHVSSDVTTSSSEVTSSEVTNMVDSFFDSSPSPSDSGDLQFSISRSPDADPPRHSPPTPSFSPSPSSLPDHLGALVIPPRPHPTVAGLGEGPGLATLSPRPDDEREERLLEPELPDDAAIPTLTEEEIASIDSLPEPPFEDDVRRSEPSAPAQPIGHVPSMRIAAPGVSPFRERIANVSLCSLLDCKFDGGDFCSWDNFVNKTTPIRSGNWRIGEGQGDGKKSGFAFVESPIPSSKGGRVQFLLASPLIQLTQDVTILVDVYRHGRDVSLQACFDSTEFCPVNLDSTDPHVEWTDAQRIRVPKGTTKVYIKAIQWRAHKWLAIENLHVEGGCN